MYRTTKERTVRFGLSDCRLKNALCVLVCPIVEACESQTQNTDKNKCTIEVARRCYYQKIVIIIVIWPNGYSDKSYIYTVSRYVHSTDTKDAE